MTWDTLGNNVVWSEWDGFMSMRNESTKYRYWPYSSLNELFEIHFGEIDIKDLIKPDNYIIQPLQCHK